MMIKRFLKKVIVVCGIAAILLNGEFARIQATEKQSENKGYDKDSYCGYLYVCFTCENLKSGTDERDVEQVHFYLSEDGLNWTSVNGNKPAFTAGKDYMDYITESSYNFDKSRVINYGINKSVYSNEYIDFINNGNSENRFYEYNVMNDDILSKTKTGDASALYPFEGNDQGIRDPYIIRGCKADGSDKDKMWILATDLNIMSDKYGDKVPNNNFNNSVYGNWGYMNSKIGSQNIFVYETSDKLKSWTRRYVDVGSSEKLSESSGMDTDTYLTCAWAPEAIYNPEKDNYLVYWSSELSNSSLGKMIFCCETDDFETFGDVRLYVNEKARTGINNFTCIDASQMQVKNDDGSYSYFRVIKNESDAHINLEQGDSVLDSSLDYDDKALLADFIKSPNVNTAKNVALGNHFYDVQQTTLSSYRGSYEGATLFPFYDRKEWCVMVDNYGYMAGRYFPLVSTDLSVTDSIKKVESGYGRSIDEKTGLPEVACHGGMIPITASEYNSILDIYNSDKDVENYHEIEYMPIKESEKTDNGTNTDTNNQATNPPVITAAPSTEAPLAQVTIQPVTQTDNQSNKDNQTIKKPAKVKITSVKHKKNWVNIRWKKVKGAKGYQVIISTDKTFKSNNRKIITNKLRLVINKINSKKIYYIKVAAYTKSNYKKVYGKYCDTYKISK